MEQLTHQKDYEGKQIQGSRNYQEDDFGFDASHADVFLMVLADGMGGYIGGNTASSNTIKTFMDTFNPKDSHTTSERLNVSMQAANAKLATIIEKKPDLEGMGCTFVGAVLTHDFTRLHWISVGDSPFWLVRRGKLIRLNVDHSKRTKLLERVKKGEITSAQAATDPERNSLTSALTGTPPALVDNNSKGVESGDILLLASDGLLTLEEQEIEQIIKQANNSVDDLTNRLLGGITRKARAGQDNATVLVVKIPERAVPEVDSCVEDRAVIVDPFHTTKDNKKAEPVDSLSEKIDRLLTYIIIALVLALVVVGLFSATSKLVEDEPLPLKVNGGRETKASTQTFLSKPNQEQEDTSTNIATKVLIETEGKKEDSNENEPGQAEPNPQ